MYKDLTLGDRISFKYKDTTDTGAIFEHPYEKGVYCVTVGLEWININDLEDIKWICHG